MKPVAWLLLPLLLVPLFVTGCWDRKEINDVAFVLGDALDKEKDKYRLTVQVPLPSQMGDVGSSGGGGGTSGAKSWYIDSVLGDAGWDMIMNQQQKLSRTLYFAHRRVILIGEEAARGGLSRVFDVYSRVPQNRMTAFVCITHDSARDLLNSDEPTEQTPSEVVRELAQNSMKQPRTLKHVVDAMLTDGIDPIAPAFQLEKTKPGPQGQSNMAIKINGLALFHQSKLVSFLDAKQASPLLWAMNQAKRPTLLVHAPRGDGDLALQFPLTDANLKPELQGQQILMHVKVSGRGALVENHSTYDISSKENLVSLERTIEGQLKQEIAKTVAVLQETKADPIGFGSALHREFPTEWQQWRTHFDDIYPKIKVVVEPEIHIENTGTLTKPLGQKEGNLVQ